jgi:glycosyltransferase involved in cell wall biosynthesis
MSSGETSPLVSVIIPSYNHEKYIGETVNSVLNSSIRDLELIVVDDGSRDGSVEIIKSFQDPRLKLICQENAGAHRAMNRGASIARAPWLAFLNSDDRFHPRKLEAHLETHLKDAQLEATATRIRYIDGNGTELKEKHPKRQWYANALAEHHRQGSLYASLFMVNHLVTTSALFVKQNVFNEIGGFGGLRYTHDWLMFLSLASRQRFKVIEQPLLDYRVHDTNTIEEDLTSVDLEVNFLLAWRMFEEFRNGSPRLSPEEVIRLISQNRRLAPRLFLFFQYMFTSQDIEIDSVLETFLSTDHPIAQYAKQILDEDGAGLEGVRRAARKNSEVVSEPRGGISQHPENTLNVSTHNGRSLSGISAELGRTRALLDQKEARLESVFQSYSWRITAPLRWGLDHLVALKKSVTRLNPQPVGGRKKAYRRQSSVVGAREHPLAVTCYFYGAPSETFIRRHMFDLLPKKTVIIAVKEHNPFGWPNRADGPLLITTQLPAGADETDAVADLFIRHNVKVVLGEFLNMAYSWIDLADDLGIRLYGHAHGADISQVLRNPVWQERYRKYNKTAGVITVSQVSKARLTQIGIEESKIHVVPCGVDVPASPIERPDRDTVTCLAVGRFVPKKAPLKTLDAFSIAAQDDPRLRLVFVGDGPLMEDARNFTQGCGISEKVRFTGVIPNDQVRQLMKDSDIFVQHSIVDPIKGDEEGMPVAIREAMAHSMPVVSTRHAGIPEAVEEGTSGLLVDEGDVEGMAACIRKLAGNHRTRLQMGRAGWSKAASRFSWDREKKDLLRILGL